VQTEQEWQTNNNNPIFIPGNVALLKFSHWWMTHDVDQRFPIPFLALPVLHIFPCLAWFTHPIQIISSLEVSYLHELCSNWCDPYTVFIASSSLSMGKPFKFTSLRNMGWNWEPVMKPIVVMLFLVFWSVSVYAFRGRGFGWRLQGGWDIRFQCYQAKVSIFQNLLQHI